MKNKTSPTDARIRALTEFEANEELEQLEDAGLDRSPLADRLRLHILALTGRVRGEVSA